MEELIRMIIEGLGEDPDREGLRRTPARVCEALRYLTKGYGERIDDIVNGAIFEADTDEMVVVRDIELYSLCEHHMLPFFGKAHVGYIPGKKIIGLSKIPRIVDTFARRLQLQERLTSQIAECIKEQLSPRGVMVVIDARHLCTMMRGVEKQNSSMVTSACLGSFRSSNRTRSEFLSLIRHH